MNFEYIFKGDKNAISFAFMLWNLCQFWDDLVDKDKDLSEDDINRHMLMALYELPKNPVYMSMPEMPYHIYNVFLRWRDSTAMEKSLENGDKEKCYMLRAGVYDLFVLIAAHLYGDEWAKEIGVYVRRCYGETLDNFLEAKNA